VSTTPLRRAACGKTEAEMRAVLKTSGLSRHGELRAFAMEQLGHANALAACSLKREWQAVKQAAEAAAKKPAART
jgi:hypothetical protein